MGILHIMRLIHDMLQVNLMDRAAVEALQEQRFRAMLRHAVALSPFYREKYRSLDIETCAPTDLPIVTKKEMMDNFDDFVTDRRLRRAEIRRWLEDKNNLGRMYLNQFIPFHTSGTTGENALVLYDRRGLDYVHAATMARHTMAEEPSWWERLKIGVEMLIHRMRVATVVMTGGPYPAYTAASYTPRAHDLFVRQRIFPLREPIPKIVADLNEFQPEAVISYPSLLSVLAREQLAGRLAIRFTRRYSSVAAASEPLSEQTKQLAKKAWGVGIQDTYGTAECFIIARSCRCVDRMHVMTDLCRLEIVTRDNRPVPDGQPGDKVLITNLFNTVQPFIRYEVSDVTGYSTQPCACGLPFPTLLPVEGRTDDIFYIDRPGGGYEAVHPYLFLGPMVELEDVREFQLAQTGRNEITYYYVPLDAGADIAAHIRHVLETGLAHASLQGRIAIKIERVEAIDRDARSGKFRTIVSRVGAPADLDQPYD